MVQTRQADAADVDPFPYRSQSKFLTAEEVAQLTGRVQRAAQRVVLNALGITHQVWLDRSLVVLRLHVEQLLGVEAVKTKAPDIEPNWDSI